MQRVRQLVQFMMFIIILPWGAYVSAFPVPAGNMATSAQGDADEAGEAAVLAKMSQTKVSASRKCRTAGLPGFRCGPDPVIPITVSRLWPAPQKAGFPPGADWAARGRSEPPPNDPPRFF